VNNITIHQVITGVRQDHSDSEGSLLLNLESHKSSQTPTAKLIIIRCTMIMEQMSKLTH